MRRRRLAPFLSLLALAASACVQAPVEVQTYDTERADLSAIRSFALIPPPWPHPVAGPDVEKEIRKTHGVHLVGRTDEVREEFYVITVERRISHPAVAAIADAARHDVLD